MGLVLKVKNADYSANAIAYIPPVANGLEYLNFFGGSEELLTRNLASGKAAGAVAGSPVVNANSVRFGRNTGFIQTAVEHALDDDVTMLIVAKAIQEGTGTIYIGNNTSASQLHAGTTQGRAIFSQNSIAADSKLGLTFQSAETDGVTSSSVTANINEGTPGVSLNTPFFAAARHNTLSETRYLINKTSGLSASGAGSGLDNDAGQPYRIGAAYQTGNFGDNNEIYFAAIYSRALSDAEITKMYALLKTYYGSLGVII